MRRWQSQSAADTIVRELAGQLNAFACWRAAEARLENLDRADRHSRSWWWWSACRSLAPDGRDATLRRSLKGGEAVEPVLARLRRWLQLTASLQQSADAVHHGFTTDAGNWRPQVDSDIGEWGFWAAQGR